MEWMQNPEYWVLVAFVIFCGLLWRAGVPGQIAKALDGRADAIRHELDQARRLREEAQALLVDYQKKQRDADTEAKAIVDAARAQAETLAAETRRSLAEQLARRTKQAEDKIARAEALAVSEVRALAVDRALAASATIIAAKSSGAQAGAMVDMAIRDLEAKLG